MRTRIKICCMASLEEAQLAVRAGADAVGLVGIASSPRALDDGAIAAIVAGISIETVLLTAQPTAAGIARHAAATGVSTVQIVSHLDPVESEQLPNLLPTARRVQVVHVEDETALDLIDRYAPYVHAFLLDSGRPCLQEYGGTGRTHDWSISAEFVRRSPHPVFLAGGLSAGNVGEAMSRVRPFGVDLCSGVRTGGRLDSEKLEAFVSAARMTDTALSESFVA